MAARRRAARSSAATLWGAVGCTEGAGCGVRIAPHGDVGQRAVWEAGRAPHGLGCVRRQLRRGLLQGLA
jgi:hypothetical protein